jgi:hypothetical protein
MIIKDTTENALINHENAAVWLRERNVHPGQRPFDQEYAKTLGNTMLRNAFAEYTEVWFAVLKNTFYVVNGQHTLGGVVWAKKPYQLKIRVTEVTMDDDIRHLIATANAGKPSRPADIYRAYGLDTRLGLHAEELQRFGAATRLLIADFRDSGKTYNLLKAPDLKAAHMLAWTDEGQMYLRDIAGAPQASKSLFTRSAVWSVALVTYRFNAVDAQEFWHAASHEQGHMGKLLRDWLLATPASGKYGKREYAQHVAYAWYLWMEEETRQVLQLPGEWRHGRRPLEIAATPYTGKATVVWHTTLGLPQQEPEIHAWETQ